MLLAVDIGNTKIKAAVFEGNVLINSYAFEAIKAITQFSEIFDLHPLIRQNVIVSVGHTNPQLFQYLKDRAPVMVIGQGTPMPFYNKYMTPDTLGTDRMVLAAGAVLQYPGKNRLVIDAGTCVTYDFTDSSGNYLGGAISPGLRLRYEAMHNFTAKLPLLYPEMPEYYIGNSTKLSMHSGSVWGLLHELEGFIGQYNEQYQDVTVILTGGDADFLAKRLKNTIFANSNFLLESLNLLYLYTIKND